MGKKKGKKVSCPRCGRDTFPVYEIVDGAKEWSCPYCLVAIPSIDKSVDKPPKDKMVRTGRFSTKSHGVEKT